VPGEWHLECGQFKWREFIVRSCHASFCWGYSRRPIGPTYSASSEGFFQLQVTSPVICESRFPFIGRRK
jgi:hypothetical protein